MYLLKRESSPRYQRDNIESFLLVSSKTCHSKKMAITLVEMKPGGIQHTHNHKQEQMYYIMQGKGTITVNNESKHILSGDCIYFPSYAKHGLINTGNSILKYISACSPSFSLKECKTLWPLKSIHDI